MEFVGMGELDAVGTLCREKWEVDRMEGVRCQVDEDFGRERRRRPGEVLDGVAIVRQV